VKAAKVNLNYKRYRLEVSPPKQAVNHLSERLTRFDEKYNKAVDAGHCVCVTDNAMGNLAFQGHELIQELKLPVRFGQVMIHLNTFHTLSDLHWILDSCGELGIKEILVVSGDGSVRLPKLKPSEIDCDSASVTSVELLGYIRKIYGSAFILGAAFNQYEPEAHEILKFRRKIEAGAEFIVTQPMVGRNELIEKVMSKTKIPFIIEAWMSPNIKLLSDCIGYSIASEDTFDPMACLESLRNAYPANGFYLALLDFKTQFNNFQIKA